ncbi:hypothetical protein MFLAVUS_005481 [Mucor flavus]|uniref:Uncharacterized protein n=1 Tax=Mucor flavus TaxID=439312 RepID=A0ABP9YYU7_9FUNG
MSSSHASKHIKEWLPMPSGLSFTDNSFSADLLKQFDKRRSQLNSDEISIEQHQQQQQQQQYTDNMIQPPIITQYPPKPLKYSPVEPLPAEAYAGSDQHNNTSNRNTLKRLSLPLLKLTAASQAATSGNTLHRRRSDSDLLNQPTNQPNHTFFRSLSKRWNKLLTTCKSKRIKNKRNGAA